MIKPTLLYFFTLLLWLNCVNTVQANNPVNEGLIQLSQAELTEKIKLDGNWLLYWNTSYAEWKKNQSQHAESIQVPGPWTSINHPGHGMGLYTLTLLGNQIKDQTLGLYIPFTTTNYKVFVNGLCIDSVGRVSKIASQSKPEYHPKLISFRPNSDTLQIAIEVSNFYYHSGGLTASITIGLIKPLANQFHKNLVVEALLCGALLLMFFYYMGFYFIRKSEKAHLFFAILCLMTAIRILATGQMLIRQLELPINWFWLFKIELVSIIILPVVGGLYLFQLLDLKKFKTIFYTLNGISLFLGVYVILTNSNNASFIIPYFHYLALVELLFLLFIIGYSFWIIKHPYAQLAGIGYIFVTIFSINDILFSRGIINTTFLVPLGIMVYVILQAIILTQKFATSYKVSEELSQKLVSVNQNQETIINQRTSELQNYNRIKDKIFTIIGHDLKAPIATLSNVLNLAEQADDKTLGELRTYFKSIKRNVDNLNLTIENLFQWSQNQINGIQKIPQVINIKSELECILSLYTLTALQKEIILINNVTTDLKVLVDNQHFNLIIRNILSNAIKYTNKYGTISLKGELLTDGKVLVCITDNGIGIHPAKLSELFNMENIESTQGTLNEKGTGLGLKLCKEYIEVNGGSISVESSLQEGTKVCLKFVGAA